MHFHLDGFWSALPVAIWCGAPPRSIPALLLLTGLVGGLAHCGPMCGPFVLAQVAAAAPAGGPIVGRLAGGLLLPYHLGRITTYAMLGALAAAFGAGAAALLPVRLGVAALLGIAALCFLAQATARLLPWRSRSGEAEALAQRWAGWLVRLAGPLLAGRSGSRRFALGLVLGLLPCGFLYGALAAAAATQQPLAGAAAMLAFGLGTVPSLFVVGAGGAACAARWRRLARRAVAPLFIANAGLLTALAVSLLLPP